MHISLEKNVLKSYAMHNDNNNEQAIVLPSWLLVSQGGSSLSQLEAWYLVARFPGKTVNEYEKLLGWSVHNVLSLLQQIEHWHSSCNNIVGTTVGVGVYNRESIYNNNNNNITNDNDSSLAKKETGKSLLLNETEYAVDPSTDDSLLLSVRNGSDTIALLESWSKLWLDSGRELHVLPCKTLAVASKICRDGNQDKAITVLQWAFNSDHYRAKWLRSKNMLWLHNLCNSNTLHSNLALTASESSKKEEEQKPTRRLRRRELLRQQQQQQQQKEK